MAVLVEMPEGELLGGTVVVAEGVGVTIAEGVVLGVITGGEPASVCPSVCKDTPVGAELATVEPEIPGPVGMAVPA
jgi:hypothetical protein